MKRPTHISQMPPPRPRRRGPVSLALEVVGLVIAGLVIAFILAEAAFGAGSIIP